MGDNSLYPVSGEQVINAFERFLPLIDTERAKDRLLRIYSVLLQLRKYPGYFNVSVKALDYIEKILRKNNDRVDIDGFSDLINTPFLFEHISDGDAVKVKEYLDSFFSEENSLEKYFLTEFKLKPLNSDGSKISCVQNLLSNRHLKERFNFFPNGKFTAISFVEEIIRYYEKQGYELVNKVIDSMSLINMKSNDKGAIMVSVTYDPGRAIMVSVNEILKEA